MRGAKNERDARRGDQGGDGLPERRAGHSGLDLPAGELRVPDLRLRLGPAVRPLQRDRRADQRAAADQAVSRCWCRRSTADGNELGGVPTVLRDAPLGTYLGWNITAGASDATYDGRPFHAGQVCNYVGGMVPFAKTRRSGWPGDPRLSLRGALRTARRLRRRGEEGRRQRGVPGLSAREGGRARRLDAQVQRHRPGRLPGRLGDLVNQAINSNVCNQPSDGGKCNPQRRDIARRGGPSVNARSKSSGRFLFNR